MFPGQGGGKYECKKGLTPRLYLFSILLFFYFLWYYKSCVKILLVIRFTKVNGMESSLHNLHYNTPFFLSFSFFPTIALALPFFSLYTSLSFLAYLSLYATWQDKQGDVFSVVYATAQ